MAMVSSVSWHRNTQDTAMTRNKCPFPEPHRLFDGDLVKRMLIFTLAMSTPGCCRLDAHLDVNDDALDGDQIFMTGLQNVN
jgi:hypothetical protein